MIRLFALDSDLIQWQEQLALASGQARLPLLMQLAWHLRERDSERAWLLADEIEALLASAMMVNSLSQPDVADGEMLLARIKLLRGEILFLRSELAAAFAFGQSVLQAVAPLVAADRESPVQAVPLQVDALILLALVCAGRGDFAQRADYLRSATQVLRASVDEERKLVCDSMLAVAELFQDAPRAAASWRSRFELDCSALHPGVQAHVYYYHASARAWTNEVGDSIQYWIAAFEAAHLSGQLRWAILALSNTGASFNAINEHYAALEWMERALELARATNWRSSIAIALAQVGETLRLQGQLVRADEFLREALVQFGNLGKSRNFVLTLAYRAELALDQQDFDTALDFFGQLEQDAQRIMQSDFQSQARRGMAQALLGLGQRGRALTAALEALEFAHKIDDVMSQIETLKVLGKIYASQYEPGSAPGGALDHGKALAQAACELPPPPDCSEASPCLHYLLKAWHLALGLQTYQIGSGLPDALAREYARLGDFQQAFLVTQSANLARDQNHRLEGTKRTIAMRVAHRTANARAASEHHRQLLDQAARRALSLQQSSATLQKLSEIGLQITAQLDLQQVLQALAHHARRLLEADSVLIFLLDARQQALHLALGLDQTRTFAMEPLDANDPSADSVRCWLQRSVILRHYEEPETDPNRIRDTTPVRSALFAPLALANQVLGVMSVQSMRAHAFDEQQQLIFRTLCAYGAIAIDNARTYSQVQQAQAQLVEQQKLVALGQLVASVAQELREPLTQCRHKVGQLQHHHANVQAMLRHGRAPERDPLLATLAGIEQLATDINGGLLACAELVKSFKQVAVDRKSVEVRDYSLSELCDETVALMLPQAMMHAHNITLQVDRAIQMRGYPATLSQVMENLISNAINHAFPARQGGQLCLTASLTAANRVQLCLQDDGIGIASDDLQRIFTPFMHTRLAQGRYGLGLHVSYNLVTSLLQGQIRIESRTGAGTTVTLDLPVQLAGK
jgi:signal transduction histidine kinase